MQRGLQITLVIAIVIMAGFVTFLYFRQIPKQVAKKTEQTYTIATPEPETQVTTAPEAGSQTASIKNTSDLNVSSSDLDGANFSEFDKELNEVKF